MVNQLLLPGHVENIAGFPGFRAALERVFGPMSTQALASQIFGLYSGFVYFTPVLGGWIADRFVGQRNAVVAGAVLMSAGHLAMAFDQSFLAALALLDPRQRTPEGQHRRTGGRALRHRRRSQPRARLHDLPDGDQRRRDARPDRLWAAGATVRLAYRLRRGRSVHPHRPGDVSGRLSPFTIADGARGQREPHAHGSRVAAYPGDLRGAGDRRVPCDVVLPVVQHRRRLDPGSRRSRRWRLRHSGAVVQRGRSVVLDPRRARRVRALASAGRGARRRRTWRSGKDRHGRMAGRQRQC